MQTVFSCWLTRANCVFTIVNLYNFYPFGSFHAFILQQFIAFFRDGFSRKCILGLGKTKKVSYPSITADRMMGVFVCTTTGVGQKRKYIAIVIQNCVLNSWTKNCLNFCVCLEILAYYAIYYNMWDFYSTLYVTWKQKMTNSIERVIHTKNILQTQQYVLTVYVISY